VEQISQAGGEQLPGWQPDRAVVIQEGSFAGRADIFEAWLSPRTTELKIGATAPIPTFSHKEKEFCIYVQ